MKRILSIVLLLTSSMISFGQTNDVQPKQDFFTVNCPGEGKLFKGVKKSDYENLSELKIVGELNEKDFQKLGKLGNLKVLDLSEADFRDKIIVSEAIKTCTKVETVYLTNLGHHLPFPSLKQIIVGYLDGHYWCSQDMVHYYPIIPIESITFTEGCSDNFYKKKRGDEYGWYQPQYIITNTGIKVNNVSYDDAPADYATESIYLEREKQFNVPEVLDLREATYIADYVFAHCNMSKVIISSKIEHIGAGAFSSCENLKEVIIEDGDGTTVIEHNAFNECKNLKSLIFGTNVIILPDAFYKTDIETAVFRQDAKIEDGAFSKIRFAEFSKTPSKISSNFSGGEPSIHVPQGTSEQFINKGFKQSQIADGESNLEYNIKLEKGGTILSRLPVNDLTKIKSLTITGVLYETDFQIISKCTNLEYLDLSHAFTTLSPEAMASRQAEKEMLSGLFSLMSAALDAQYENYEIRTGDYTSSKIMMELAKDAYSVKSNDPACQIPHDAINDLRKLKTLILPYRAKNIDSGNFQNCPNLEHIEWPMYLEQIGSRCFNNCPSLKEVTFPASFNYLRSDSFRDCASLAKVDLSACTFKVAEWDVTFKGCSSHFEVHLPQGITRISSVPVNHNKQEYIVYLPASVKELRDTYYYCTLHFAGEKAPTALFGTSSERPQNCKIYVPKGSLTSYYANFGGDTNGCQYVEE
ncbi:MAG: leucine-rich repeat domain-containing protein [Bacteroidaceae bacterium]|nr:leucine-rich repeat domain-containing protein [Bacteroidaceae bacterium]